MLRNSATYLKMLAERYGDIVHFKFGPQRVFLLNHPDYIRDVLVTNHENFMKGRVLQRMKRLLGDGLLTSEKDLHRRQRRLVQPAFHKQRISAYGSVVVGYADQVQRGRWRDGLTMDMAQEMSRLTLSIVGKALFGAETESAAVKVEQAVNVIVGLFNNLRFPYSEWLEKLPLPSVRRFKKARAQLDEIIYAIIEQRRGGDTGSADLLSMLLAAQDDEGDARGMSASQLRDEVMTIFLAGHETTANALTWTWYLLSQHRGVEERLHEELGRVLAGRMPQAADLPRLQYTEMVLKEAMRLYPPAWTVNRTVIRDYPVGGYVIPAGSVILMSQYVMHRDARYYDRPDSFDPQRWTPAAQAARPQFSYFPFGGGPRRCVGEGFAMLEAVLILAALATSWRMVLAPGHPVEVQPLVTLRPRHGMMMVLHRRRAGRR